MLISYYLTPRFLSLNFVTSNLLRHSSFRLCHKIKRQDGISPFLVYKVCLEPVYESVSVNSCKFHFTKSFSNFSKLNTSLISRNMSSAAGDCSNGNVNYEQLIKLKDQEEVLVIDVREKAELEETGTIPGSFNIPVGEVSDAFNKLNDEVFEEKYGFKKPSEEDTIIFSCRSGKRSVRAQEDALKAGYKNSLNFTGGWLEWEEKTGNTKK